MPDSDHSHEGDDYDTGDDPEGPNIVPVDHRTVTRLRQTAMIKAAAVGFKDR